jgi:hypothetical protein
LFIVGEVIRTLSELQHGDGQPADKLLPILFDELRKLAAARMSYEKPGQSLQATALVHEAYIRLVDTEKPLLLRHGANLLRRRTGDGAGDQRGCLQLCDCLKSNGAQPRNGPAKRREDAPICNAKESTSEDSVAQLVFCDHKHQSRFV